jgi:hypothetical protein
MRYGIIQNDNRQQTLFWSEKLKQWIEVEGQYSAMRILAKAVRGQKYTHKSEEILEAIVGEINKKYA